MYELGSEQDQQELVTTLVETLMTGRRYLFAPCCVWNPCQRRGECGLRDKALKIRDLNVKSGIPVSFT